MTNEEKKDLTTKKKKNTCGSQRETKEKDKPQSNPLSPCFTRCSWDSASLVQNLNKNQMHQQDMAA